MVKMLKSKFSPTKGFAHIFHLSFIALLPPAVLLFARIDLFGIALAIILLSKWRMLAVKPRHWPAHVRTNAVDIIVGLSMLGFIVSTSSFGWQLFWVAVYEVWLLIIKPRSNAGLVSLQALIALGVGLTSVFIYFQNGYLALYVILFWFISYFSARHFLGSFDEPHAQIIASQWGFFAASLVWVLGHWLLFFGAFAVPALLVFILGFGLGGLYYLNETDKLSGLIRKQIIFVMVFLILILLIFSDWGDKAI